MSLDFIDTDKLPPNAQELIALLGDALAYKLMSAVGGTIVNVPTHAGKLCALKVHLTQTELEVLCAHYRGERLQVPKYDSVARQVRNAKIRTLRREGWTIPQTALHFGLSARQVSYITGEEPEPPSNFDLFEHMPP